MDACSPCVDLREAPIVERTGRQSLKIMGYAALVAALEAHQASGYAAWMTAKRAAALVAASYSAVRA